jgi:hypothetical protein
MRLTVWLTLLFLTCWLDVLSSGSALAKKGRPRSPEWLLVKSRDPQMRESAAQVLGLRRSVLSLPLLVKRLAKDENLWVRARCAESLGLLGATAAVTPLASALAREKNQRVRRTIAEALVRLGQKKGVEELLWQLKAGTNHTKAEVMTFLVSFTGQPLGQDPKAWWAYFSRRGYQLMSLRPPGGLGLYELRGLALKGTRTGPLVSGKEPTAWRQLPAVVLRLEPSRRPVTARTLREYERRHGKIPDGCFLLLRTGWRDAKAEKPLPTRKGQAPQKPPGPGLGQGGAKHLLRRAPRLLGVGIDTPTLDPPAGDAARSARETLLAERRLVIESLDDLDRIPAGAARLLLVGTGGRQVRVFAALP